MPSPAVLAPLSPADRDRLRRASGRVLAADEPLFGPASAMWRINREACLLLAGGRALLMQVAHPLVAAGVAAHSRFRDEPLQRLWRTLELMQTIVFADAGEAVRAVRIIDNVHRRVRGVLEEEAGPFARGTPYAAGDPHLLLWVHATLVDSALVAHEHFAEPLPPAVRRRYHRESKVVARLFGVPEELIPRTLRDFRAYVRGMVESEVLAVSDESRAIADGILHPPLPPGLRHAVESTALITAALLPPTLRRRYGLPWSAARQYAFDALAALLRRSRPIWPRSLLHLPQAARGHGDTALAAAVRLARG
jgi:uncharacterized protein (DUF2236 family)